MQIARTARALLLPLLLLCVAPAPGSAAWRYESGECVEYWTAREVARGPLAVANGALYPVRSFLGGLVFSAAVCAPQLSCAPFAPLWLVGSTLWGVGEGAYWIATGAIDTLTGSRLLLSPPRASELALYPHVPFLQRDHADVRCP